MVESRVFRWANGSTVEEEWCDPHAGSVRAADSWLVVEGTAVHVERHLDRFRGSVATQGLELDTDAFANDVLGLIPTEGRWFPRVEAMDYDDGAILRFHLRPAPEPLTEAIVGTATRDPRTLPLVKGPDLAALGAVRRELDLDEAVILDGENLAEGAWSSIVWWANDTLHVVDPAIPRLPSVTEQTLRDHAAFIGAPVIPATVRPDELDGAEVWVLSALHGIRVVTEWRNGPTVHVEPGRAEYWRQQYVNQRTVISAS